MLSPKTRRNISRVLPFGLIWLFFSIVYTLLERGILGSVTRYPTTGNPYNFYRNLSITPVSAFVTGLLIGIIEIKYFNRLFIKISFGKKIVFKSLIYLAIIIIFLLFSSALTNSIELHSPLFGKQVWSNTLAFLKNNVFWSVGIYMAAIIVVTQFYSEVSENLGHGVLQNFFSGKYHEPAEEERIFMFLDMKSSTTIAENLGHVRYFEMLREYYSDLSDPVINHAGEIYQYVGDEIIVSWKLRKGLESCNCIECFFAIKKGLREQAKKYREKFGFFPEFKAGFHIGKVTTGEIGTIKKEIIFTGDVLNTTARIQGLCNSYHTDIILSGHLAKRLAPVSSFQFISLGETRLRGRDEKIELYTIEPAAQK